MDLIIQSVPSYSKRGGDGCNVILSSCEYHFIIVHENLVQHPSNNILIDYYLKIKTLISMDMGYTWTY